MGRPRELKPSRVCFSASSETAIGVAIRLFAFCRLHRRIAFRKSCGSFQFWYASHTGFSISCKLKERSIVVQAVTFLLLALRQRTSRNAIQFSRYLIFIIAHGIKVEQVLPASQPFFIPLAGSKWSSKWMS